MPDTNETKNNTLINEIMSMHRLISDQYKQLNVGMQKVENAYNSKAEETIGNLKAITDLYKTFNEINLEFQDKMHQQLNKYADSTLEYQKKYDEYFKKNQPSG